MDLYLADRQPREDEYPESGHLGHISLEEHRELEELYQSLDEEEMSVPFFEDFYLSASQVERVHAMLSNSDFLTAGSGSRRVAARRLLHMLDAAVEGRSGVAGYCD